MTVAAAIERAYEEKIVRIQTPIALLEMGMQANNFHVAFLLWAIAPVLTHTSVRP